MGGKERQSAADHVVQPPPPPSEQSENAIRADAKAGRRAALVGHSLDPVTGFPRLFNLFTTFPWHLRRHSTFLALHFGMLGLFALLLLGYTLLAIWPVANFVDANSYKDEFRLVVDGNEDFCEGVKDSDGQNLYWKPKEYLSNNWGRNLILGASLGSYCGPHSFSNALDCGDTCKLFASDLAALPQQALLEDGSYNKTMICQTTYPCSTPCGTEFDPETNPPQPTPCCVFGAFKLDPSEIEKLDPLERKAEKQEAKKMCARNLTFVQRKDEGITAKLLLEEFTRDVEPHVWLWCVPGMMFFVVWISMLQYLQHALAEAGNRQNINVSQYAVMISNVGGVIADDERLKDFGRYYGDVVAAFHVRDYGRYLIKNLERKNGNKLLRELERVKQECEDVDIDPTIAIQRRFTSFPSKWFFWLYKRWLCWHMSVDDTIKALETRDEMLSEEIERLSMQPAATTGNAIIVFNWVHNAANMLHDHNSRNNLANLFVPPTVGQAFNVLTDGALARTPKILLTEGEGSARRTTHRYVSVSRAPEPNDLWWENTLYGGWPIIKRRILAWLGYFAFLGVSFCVQAVLAFLSAQENRDNVEETLLSLRRYSGDGEDGGALFSNFDPIQTIDSLKWTIAKTLLTLAFSAAGILLIHYISDYSLFVRHTRNESSTVTKIALFQLINTFVVPVVAFLASGDGSFGLWYTSGGLAELAFLVQVANAFAGSIAFLFRVDDVFYLHLLSRMACSKVYANEYMHPPAFRMNLRLGQAVTTVGLSILYAPILPLSPLIGLIGTIFQYSVDQYVALRHSSKPRTFQVEALTGVNYILRFLPLAQVILIWALYFDFSRGNQVNPRKLAAGSHVPEILGVIIWAVASIVPLMNRVRQVEYKRWVEGGRPRLLEWAKPPGQRQQTWTNHAQMTSALNALPDLPKGFRINYDTYLPDVPSLDSEIFTSKIKPHFTYHSPALPQTRFVQQPGATVGNIGNFEFKQVAPKEQFTKALAKAKAVDVPDALANTCNFRHTDLAEFPEILESIKSGVESFTPKTFTPDCSDPAEAQDAGGSNGSPPQTYVPAAARSHHGRGHRANGSSDNARSPQGGMFVPDQAQAMPTPAVFVPDDDTAMPMPPGPQEQQHGYYAVEHGLAGAPMSHGRTPSQ